MAQTPAERARAYRERKRHAVTPHSCEACGHTHYPSQRDATGDQSSQRDATPEGKESSRCDACAQAQSERADAIRAGLTWKRRYESDHEMLTAHIGYLADVKAAGPALYARLEEQWEAAVRE